jgi:hypothetical protein
MKRLVALLTVSLFSLFSCKKDVKEEKKSVQSLSSEDSIQIVQLILEEALKPISDSSGDIVVLDAPHIKRELFPDIEGVKFIFITQSDIKKKAEINGKVSYLWLARIMVSESRAYSAFGWDTEPVSLLSGVSGVSMEFKKRRGKWVGEVTGGWCN